MSVLTCVAVLVSVWVEHRYDVEREVGQDVLGGDSPLGELPHEVGDHRRRDPLPSVDSYNDRGGGGGIRSVSIYAQYVYCICTSAH